MGSKGQNIRTQQDSEAAPQHVNGIIGSRYNTGHDWLSAFTPGRT